MTDKNQPSKKNMNLYQKLVEVRKCVEYVQKDAKGHNHSYAKESSILMSIRPKMDEVGVFLEVDMISLDQTSNDRCLKAVFEFTWVNADDPSEKIVKKVILQNVGMDAKTVGGMLTYANRYFILKTFQIATDDDDIDKVRSGLITKEQINTLELTMNGYQDIKDQISKRFKGNLSDMTESQYFLALTWVENEIKNKEKKHD